MDTICENGIKFDIDSDGYIISIANTSIFRKDAVIPKVFSNGREVNGIDTMHCCEGAFRKIIISDDISDIRNGAFAAADVNEVVWPANCTVIPSCCFAHSPSLKRISDIDHVSTIGVSAFEHCKFEDFVWPSKCSTVPRRCFMGTPLAKISNTDCIEIINTNAFCLYLCTVPEFFIDLSGNAITLIDEGAFAFCKQENIVMLYYISEEDKKKAFCEIDEG